MPKIKSQVKRMKRSKVQARGNRHVKSTLKTYVANFNQAYEAQNKEAAQTAMTVAFKALDQAAAKTIIHPSNAANKKSRISKKFNALLKS